MYFTQTAHHHALHKNTFLKNAIVPEQYVENPVKKIRALQYGFSTFVTMLHQSIQDGHELESARVERETEVIINYVRTQKTHLAISAANVADETINTLLGNHGRPQEQFDCKTYNLPRTESQNANPCCGCGEP